MTDEQKVFAVKEKLTYCNRLLGSYDLVLEDLSDWEADGEVDANEWKFVCDRLRAMRADIVEEIEVSQQCLAHWRVGVQ